MPHTVFAGEAVLGLSRLEFLPILFSINLDWLSECYKRYLTFDFNEKLSVSEAMATKIIKTIEN